MSQLKSALFWPLVLIVVALAAVFGYRSLGDGGGADNRPESFELFLKEVVRETGNIELLEVSFEHWQKQTVSATILEPGPAGLLLRKYVPSMVLNKLKEQGWNQSTADIITSCTASVEFEINIAHKDWGTVMIDGDVATVTAPVPAVSSINIRPETLRAWVLREDFLIDGEKEAARLLEKIRPKLRQKVESKVFGLRYREQCRQALTSSLKTLLTRNSKCQEVKHVYVRFADEPQGILP